MFEVPILVLLGGDYKRFDTLQFQNDPTPTDVGSAVWQSYSNYIAYVAQYPSGQIMGQADIHLIEENPNWKDDLEAELVAQLG